MDQTWRFVNLDRKQAHDSGETLGYLFTYRSSTIYYLSIPACPIDLSQFQFLSPEHSQKHLPGCWAGDRIICLADGTSAASFPEGCLSREEVNLYSPPQNLEHQEDNRDDTYGVGLDDAASDASLPSLCLQSSQILESCEKIALNRIVDYVYGSTSQLLFSEYRTWVLRNLSKRQYVLSKALPTDPISAAHISSTEAIELHGFAGLGLVLLSRCLWSGALDEPSELDTENLRRGVWAGDRFDVRLFDDVEEDMEGDPDSGWEDVTELALEQAFRIYRRQRDAYVHSLNPWEEEEEEDGYENWEEDSEEDEEDEEEDEESLSDDRSGEDDEL